MPAKVPVVESLKRQRQGGRGGDHDHVEQDDDHLHLVHEL